MEHVCSNLFKLKWRNIFCKRLIEYFEKFDSILTFFFKFFENYLGLSTGGSCLGGNYLEGNYPWIIIQGTITSRQLSGRNFPGGTCLGGKLSR